MLGKLKRDEIVKKIFDNQLVVKYGFDPVDISNGIHWEYKHSNNSKTYSVYLHSLEYVGYLVIVEDEPNKEKYYSKAKDILSNWIDVNNEKYIEYAWNEHAVAYRLTNIILYQNSVPNEYRINDTKFNELILRHCDFLANEKNYKPNNHGILMDESLFNASFYIKNTHQGELYRNLALNRVKLALYRDFSRKGLHTENSPEYHRMMLIVLNRFNEEVQKKGFTLTNDLNHKIKKAKQILRILLKPNGTYPLVGDTSFRHEDNFKKDFSDFIDYEAGLAIFQNENKDDGKLSDYLYFKSGYLSKTHKHFDDLSFNLMLDGNDLFIDAGKYNYIKKDPIREYIISPEAHTVPMLEGKKYHPTSPIVDQFNLGISNVEIKENYKKVCGFNKLYEGAVLKRTVILTNDGHCFLIDEVISNTEEALIQNFNINDNAEIKIIDNNITTIKINSDEYIIKPIQNEDIVVQERKGYFSKTFSKYEENFHVQYQNSLGKHHSSFIICNREKLPNNLLISDKSISYLYNNKNYSINY